MLKYSQKGKITNIRTSISRTAMESSTAMEIRVNYNFFALSLTFNVE